MRRSSNRCTAVAELVEQHVAYDDQVYRQNVQRRAVHGVCSPLLDDVKLVTLKCEGVVGIRLRHNDFRGELPREHALEGAGIDLADQIDRLGRRDSLGVREAVFDL